MTSSVTRVDEKSAILDDVVSWCHKHAFLEQNMHVKISETMMTDQSSI